MGRCFQVAYSPVYVHIYDCFGFGMRTSFNLYPFHAYKSYCCLRFEACFKVCKNLNKGNDP